MIMSKFLPSKVMSCGTMSCTNKEKSTISTGNLTICKSVLIVEFLRSDIHDIDLDDKPIIEITIAGINISPNLGGMVSVT